MSDCFAEFIPSINSGQALSGTERFFAEFILSVMNVLRMTKSEGLRMTKSEGLRMTKSEGLAKTVIRVFQQSLIFDNNHLIY